MSVLMRELDPARLRERLPSRGKQLQLADFMPDELEALILVAKDDKSPHFEEAYQLLYEVVEGLLRSRVHRILKQKMSFVSERVFTELVEEMMSTAKIAFVAAVRAYDPRIDQGASFSTYLVEATNRWLVRSLPAEVEIIRFGAKTYRAYEAFRAIKQLFEENSNRVPSAEELLDIYCAQRPTLKRGEAVLVFDRISQVLYGRPQLVELDSTIVDVDVDEAEQIESLPSLWMESLWVDFDGVLQEELLAKYVEEMVVFNHPETFSWLLYLGELFFSAEALKETSYTPEDIRFLTRYILRLEKREALEARFKLEQLPPNFPLAEELLERRVEKGMLTPVQKAVMLGRLGRYHSAWKMRVRPIDMARWLGYSQEVENTTYVKGRDKIIKHVEPIIRNNPIFDFEEE